MREFLKKYRVLLGIEILLLLVILIGCFMKREELVVSENPATWRYGTDSGAAFYMCDGISLDAGVYRLVARTVDAAEGNITVGMRGMGSSYNAVRCNDVSFVKGEDYLEFEVYVVEPVEEARLVMLAQDQEPTVLKEVSLYSTNMGLRILLFHAVVAVLLLNGLIVLRGAIMAGKISGEKLTAWLLVAGGILVACIPLMVNYFVTGADTNTKLLQIEMLADALCGNGEWSVKSLHLLWTAVLRIIGFHIMTAYKMNIAGLIVFMAVLV